MTEVLQYVIDGAALGSLYALFALGIGLIFGIMNLINFAHGELVMVGGYVLVFVSAPSTIVRVTLMIVIVIVFALVMERVAFRPVRGARADTLLVTSFAVSFLLQSLAIVLIGALQKSVGILSSLNESFTVGELSIRKLDVFTVAVTAGLLAALVVFLGRTRLGVQMRAAAEDFRMARALGVRANTVIATAFALSGLLAAVAALILVAQTGVVSPTMGLTVVLAAFIATIVGGLGSLTGAVLGGYVLGALTVALQATLPLGYRPYRDAFVFAIVVLVLILRPQGLISSRAVVERV
ncbi:MAG: branched-chain amino acid ABC transporter permease [Gaiellaceae bacterium MAG52_C11]|nr:branched-chain amino acid ABC transporter permease [Candidatus Gaiellasilicea maunaloa]